MGDGVAAAPARYAEIALQARTARIGRLLTYALPPGWTPQPGQVVWVPLQRRTEIGVVARIGVPPPRFATRRLLALLGETPLLSARQMALAEWLAERYACSLAEALSGFLPPQARATPRISLAPDAREAVARHPNGQRLLDAFGRRQ
jgi:primosomal protein N'